MSYDDLPLLQCQPVPTDAELQAERDSKHAVAVQKWQERDQNYRDGWFDAFRAAQAELAVMLARADARVADGAGSAAVGEQVALRAAAEVFARTSIGWR